MARSQELLDSYLAALKHLSGARSVSLFVPPSAAGKANGCLLQDGDPPVPELANLDTAAELNRRVQAELQEAIDDPSGRKPGEFLSWPSSSDSCTLLRVPDLAELVRGQQAAGSPRRRRSDQEPPSPSAPAAWIGFCGVSREAMVAEAELSRLHQNGSGSRPARWAWLLSLGGALAWHSQEVSQILDDPLTGLPGRTEFQTALGLELDRMRDQKRPMAVLLANPTDFFAINDRLGRDTGDEVLRDVACRLRTCHRSTDLVSRYGGAMFASILPEADAAAGTTVACRILHRLGESRFLDGEVAVNFRVGGVALDPDKDAGVQPIEVVRRVEQALAAAKKEEGPPFVLWSPRLADEDAAELDELHGIFTGNMTKDYRNMVLLARAVTAVAASSDFDELAHQVVERLHSTFRVEQVGLFHWPNEGEHPSLIRGRRRVAASGDEDGLALSNRELELVEEARRSQTVVELTPPGQVPVGQNGSEQAVGTTRSAHHVVVVPLVTDERSLGCLYLDGRREHLRLDQSDLFFLRALAAQLAVALDRARLADLERRRQEHERQRLRAEVDELRDALQQGKLVYRSEEMESLLVTARRVAPTDATVLVMGESGTGKELIARTVHELSPRRNKHLVVVDCGAIPTTLIESELFGRERGAFTGADSKRVGRLVEAHEGTVLLDEIGELPLEVQTRLLRFVQERTVTPVGGTRPQAVDVRLIAATNRDLAAEVKAGRFREDLYYRLNVIRLEVPPLRQRPQDILYLTAHFLEMYALLYHKSVRRLTPEAEALLLDHGWPGNVRELQNRVMQAVILAEGQELGPHELGLLDSDGHGQLEAGPHFEQRTNGHVTPPGAPVNGSGLSRSPAAHGGGDNGAVSTRVLWERLRSALGRQVERVLAGGRSALPPLGRWLVDDLLLEANEVSRQVAARAAALVGMPETTFRRRLKKVPAEGAAGSERSETWSEVREILAYVVRTAEPYGEDLAERAERLLLEEVLELSPDRAKTGSALLGVSAPTYRRRVAQLRDSTLIAEAAELPTA